MDRVKDTTKDEIFVDEIEKAVKDNPNDKTLGGVIRELVNSRLLKKNILKDR